MPEIEEVETVRNVLKKSILHKKIIGVDIYYDKMIEQDINEFKDCLINNEFGDIKRRGKWLIFELDKYYLLSHLRMEGKYFLKETGEERNKHEHVIIHFADNTDLRYHDTRKFGRMKIIPKEMLYETEEIKKQGKEPGSKDLTATYLIEKFKTKKEPIKTALLDQTIISGLGNIYANEVLFASNINPKRPANSITLEEAKKIVDTSASIIKKAMELGGTTIKSYTSSLGVTGHYQDYLCVHKRENCPCKVCGEKIICIKVGGRSTYYCPKCQK